jgi:hypothetical protein
VIDEAAKAQLSREIYQRRSVDVGDTRANANDAESDDEDLIGYDSIAPGLPPASSDKKKWWLDTGDPSLREVAFVQSWTDILQADPRDQR